MQQVLYSILLVGVLIFVHELGHFACAKIFGVKVLKFSLGFGPRVAGITRGETEYVIAAFPLGGYVRMLGENPTDAVKAPDRGRSFSEQPLWKRVIIVLAGPLMNLAFPVAIYFVVFLGNTSVAPPVIGTVLPGYPADGVLMPGDRVLRIDGDDIATFDELGDHFEANAGREFELSIERDGEEMEVTLAPRLTTEDRGLDLTSQVGRIGAAPVHPLATIGIVSPSQAGAAAGLRTFDRIVAAGGRPTERWIDLERVLDSNRGSMITVTYLRPVRVESALGGLGDLEIYEPHVATLTPDGGPGTGLERSGIESSDLYVWRVTVGSPAHQAGLQSGDRILGIDGEEVRSWRTFGERLLRSTDQEDQPEHQLVLRRGDQEIVRTIRPLTDRPEDALFEPYSSWAVGIQHWHPGMWEEEVAHPSPVLFALDRALEETSTIIELTFVSMLRLVQGRLSLDNLGGPIRMWEETGVAVRRGPIDFLKLMAFISINLGLLNLLPIPVLDGGHLMFLGIEAISRRPPSRKLREIASLVGLVMVVMLMVLAFTNDIDRHWPAIRAAFESTE